jgi:hypothetical protein
MFHFRQVLVRLRAGDTVREVARAGLMSRGKQAELVAVAKERGWLEPGNDLPDDEAIAAAMAPRKRAASTVSAAEPMREVVQRWLAPACRAAPSTRRCSASMASPAATPPSCACFAA